MGSISAFGIGFVVLTGVWATSISAQAASPERSELRIELEQMRNAKGMVHACLTQDRTYFPDCKADSHAFRFSLPAAKAAELRFRDLPSGSYALSVVHDENGNGKLDTFAKIPREGFGFSGNPPIGFGPPKFSEASFILEPGRNQQVIRVRYLL